MYDSTPGKYQDLSVQATLWVPVGLLITRSVRSVQNRQLTCRNRYEIGLDSLQSTQAPTAIQLTTLESRAPVTSHVSIFIIVSRLSSTRSFFFTEDKNMAYLLLKPKSINQFPHGFPIACGKGSGEGAVLHIPPLPHPTDPPGEFHLQLFNRAWSYAGLNKHHHYWSQCSRKRAQQLKKT